MATQSEFINTPVPVLNRSAFDKSHQNLLTMKVGTLTPVLVDELIPDTTIHLRAAALAKLPPLASDTFMRVKMHLEAFFVPYRILYGGYAAAMSHRSYTSGTAGQGGTSHASISSPKLPRLHVTGSRFNGSSTFAAAFGPGTLADYLGFKSPVGATSMTNSQEFFLNIFPFLAYARIYDDFYRNALVQNSLFAPPEYTVNSSAQPEKRLAALPFVISGLEPTVPGTYPPSSTSQATFEYMAPGTSTGNDTFNDGTTIGTLRQRNFGMDYFTSATYSPTLGTTPTLVVASTGTADSSGNVTASGDFTIGALRSINSLTQFAERNALCGARFSDWLKANYGVTLSEQIEGRAQYLGRMVFDVYSKGVDQTGVSAASGDVSTQNPFKTVGAQYGNAVGASEDTIVDEFYVREPGCLMVIASLVPKPTYSTGMSRYLRHYTGDGFRADLANQILENVGPQPIYKSELDGANIFGSNPDAVFGYTDRFAEYKTKFDELHGLMRDGQSLESFALQRSVGLSGAALCGQFLQIPTNFLDQVAAVSGDISNYGCWMDVGFDYKVVQPLSRYSIPSLVMPAEHGSNGHTEFIRRSGGHL